MFNKKNKTKHTLKIIIVGCGKVGSTLVEQLTKEGNDITIIDTNPDKISTLTNLYDIMGYVGNGASYSVQMNAGINDADLIIAVTESDELNLLCCTVAKRVGDCAAIARVRNPDYGKDVAYLREKLGLAMIINPDMEAAMEAARILYLPTALEVNSFAHGQAELIKFKIPENNVLDQMPLSSIGKISSNKVLICVVERDREVFIPSGDFVMQKGDISSFVMPRKNIRRFLDEIGIKTNPVKDTMIVGGGKTSVYLATQLAQAGISVKIIEKDPARCEELSILLPKATIINGEGTDEELLKEEGIETVQSFVPLTGIDEENIILTLFARQISKAKIITKINTINFKNVIEQLDLGSIIYPRYITSEAIIAYARAKKDSLSSNIETLYHMYDSRVEAIEFRVDKNSSVIDIPLMNLSLKKELLICFINRNGTIIIPSGSDCIKSGDTVMVVTKHSGLKDIQDILR
jgi:trk system potassium uptake protein TrkA